MEKGLFQRLVEVISQVFTALNAQVEPSLLEDLAVTIHQHMTLETRYYHTLEHALSFYDEHKPHQSLAALYHDLVYYQIDRALSPKLKEVIGSHLKISNGDVYLSNQSPIQDRMLGITLEIFGYRPGRKLDVNSGLNEFLSALFMTRSLEGLLAEADLVHMVACVEASIPMRGLNEQGESPFDLLAGRLNGISERYQLKFDAAQINKIVQSAVRFANRDMHSFAEEDAGRFLDVTWKMLPEINESLRSRNLYSIREYRQALWGMKNFMNNLDAGAVFYRYAGVPEREQFQQMVEQAHKNVMIAREYLQIKLLAIIILEALAEATGGDVPLSMFMGEIPAEGQQGERMQDYLPEPPAASFVDKSSVLYRLLESGRDSEVFFDLKDAPLAFFLYRSLPPQRVAVLVERGERMFAGQLSANDLLNEIDRPVALAVARACAALARTRRTDLLALFKD